VVQPTKKLIIALVKYNLGLVVLVDPSRLYSKVLVSKFLAPKKLRLLIP
jgi:hypothetical protein